MTTTSDPVEALRKNVRKLEESLECRAPHTDNLRLHMEEASRAYVEAKARYEEDLAETGLIEKGIKKHRDAIAQLANKPVIELVVENPVVDAKVATEAFARRFVPRASL